VCERGVVDADEDGEEENRRCNHDIMLADFYTAHDISHNLSLSLSLSPRPPTYLSLSLSLLEPVCTNASVRHQ
jgi:hypothetical protein